MSKFKGAHMEESVDNDDPMFAGNKKTIKKAKEIDTKYGENRVTTLVRHEAKNRNAQYSSAASISSTHCSQMLSVMSSMKKTFT